MLQDTIIEVALGLMFLYALLSLVTTSVTEGFANLFSTRERALKRWLAHMLGDTWVDARGRKQGIAKDLLNHPIIRGLAAQGSSTDYIPTPLFTKALLEVLAPPDDKERRMRPDTYEELHAMVHDIEESAPLRRVLLNLCTNTRRDLGEAERNIEMWFEASMERLSSHYGRRSQITAFVFATLVTVVGNADSLMIANALWSNSELRLSIARQAVGFDEQMRAPGEDEEDEDASSDGTDEEDAPAEPTAAETEDEGEAEATEGEGSGRKISDEQLIAELETIQAIDGFPFGWSLDPVDRRSPPNNLFDWLMKLIGFGITILATTLGAPFWFGLLSRVINLRGGGGSETTEAQNQAVANALDGDGDPMR